ncbi:hypothetical protein HNR42_000366 [Deinobacterium chartae]|uniref:Uncharacterized protein n=1 Tax=Deinobacterium chartae TaxID=521158 RepID=A0A841HWC3_9DEIO|nr:hypothetical protein [Deinobacterium chartae]MBB6096954.1 hypothetical protein [Deinobacterium chartae]
MSQLFTDPLQGSIEADVLSLVQVREVTSLQSLGHLTGHPRRRLRAALEALCQKGLLREYYLDLPQGFSLGTRYYRRACSGLPRAARSPLSAATLRVYAHLQLRPDTIQHCCSALQLEAGEVIEHLARLEAHDLLSFRYVGNMVIFRAEPSRTSPS